MELIFATNNANKVKEIQNKLPLEVRVKSLKDIGLFEDIPETGITLEENARIKTDYLVARGYDFCFADDTGLEIPAIENQPGVYSARFAGPQRNDDDNMQKVLQLLKNQSDRKARFRTVISLYFNKNFYVFEGIVEGEILKEKKGIQGFGYDPIFRPNGHDTSFAEMELFEKNKISHRARAVEKMLEFIRQMVS